MQWRGGLSLNVDAVAFALLVLALRNPPFVIDDLGVNADN